MKVLIGTTNPSKTERFQALLAGYDMAFCTLGDLGINQEPEESGKTPEENAVICTNAELLDQRKLLSFLMENQPALLAGKL